MSIEEKVLITIDSYLSDLQRASICSQLIKKIRKIFPNYKILLINKSSNDFQLQHEVDYYFNYGEGFLVGYPPQEIIDNKGYSAPYIYFDTDAGIFENWMPLTGVTDHVAGIYNSFILSAQIAKNLKFEKVFKVEFDTNFDDGDLLNIKNDVDDFQDYLFYGKRQEGSWNGPDLYMIDVHICGYSTKIFEGYDIVKNDQEYWNLCERVRYFGKWIEYLIPKILEVNRETKEYRGIDVEGYIREVYPNTNFDVVKSPGLWVDKWTHVPKICKISKDEGKSELENKVGLFFYNEKKSKISVETKISSGDKLIETLRYELKENWWAYYELDVHENITISSKYNSEDGIEFSFEEEIDPNKIKQLNCRFLTK